MPRKTNKPRTTGKPPTTRAARQQAESASNPPTPSQPGDAIRRARSAGRSVGIAVPRAARPLPVPDELAALLADALDAHANGHRVELVVHANAHSAPTAGAHSHYLILDRDPNEELTTQQAAEALKVSRPTIIKAIEDGRLAARKVGKHRRVRVYDFNAYARAEHAARVAHARESTRLEQEWGLHDSTDPISMAEWKRISGRVGSPKFQAARRDEPRPRKRS